LHDELAFTEHHSWSSPLVRRDLRHAVKVKPGFCLHDLRTRLSPNGSFMPGLPDSSVPEFLLPGKPGFSSGGTIIITHRFLPGLSGKTPVD
jgi:hypothetical protein